jgi:SAM-dependent methyltransferase
MKVCDAADWFIPEFSSIISSELHEVPRFHRKQWEFAIIFDRLQKAGALREDATGISFGSGRELPLYALANHVKQLWATDLYSQDASWSVARTDNLDEFVRGAPPFPSRIDRLSTKRMDMRQIEFPDESFDFAYSSSAVEHIGGWDDFKTHLAEVKRVLKPGGIYVMTTDIIYGPPAHEPTNFKFNAEGLEWWLRESGMDYRPVIDCRIARHYINTPLPSDLTNYLTSDSGNDRPNLFGMLVQTQMLVGCHPHSSVVLEMRKAPTDRPRVNFLGLAETTTFLKQAQQGWESFIEATNLSPHPAPYTPTKMRDRQWSTTYMWLGSKPRTVLVQIQTDGPGTITVGVDKAHTDQYWVPVVDIPRHAEKTPGHIELEFVLHCDGAYNYSIRGRALHGLKLADVRVSIQPGGEIEPVIVRRAVVPDDLAPVAPAAPPRAEPRSPLSAAVNQLLRPTGLQIVRAQTLNRLLGDRTKRAARKPLDTHPRTHQSGTPLG